MIKLCAARLSRGGVIALETPNPECLAIFATHFYLDPTHTRPVPAALLAFYMEEFGVGRIETRKLAPAVESMPSLAELPAAFRETFFGALEQCSEIWNLESESTSSLSFAVGAGFARLTRYKPFACNTGFWKTAE